MCTYNRPAHLGGAIASVLRQTRADWELLVINDGGVDVGDIPARLGDGRVKYIPQDRNRGKAACCNVGLAAAKGDYIAYLDDDDAWRPDHLEALHHVLRDNPACGGAFSDLHKVSGITDPATGKRFPLGKRPALTRDFSREVLFEHPIILHVSLMHRRDLALAAGGYDESVRVLIEWNLTRKLAYLTDLIHLPRVTGEFWAPYGSSDRISSVERAHPGSFQRNVRRIKADHPPGPWPKVTRIGLISSATELDRAAQSRVLRLIDALDYPVEVVLPVRGDRPVVLDPDGLGELKNARLFPLAREADQFQAYRRAAESFDFELLFLASDQVDPTLERRLSSALQVMKERSLPAVGWDRPGERSKGADILIRRDFFLEKMNTPRDLKDYLPVLVRSSDNGAEPLAVFKARAVAALRANRPEQAWESFRAALDVDPFFYGDNLMWDVFFPLAAALDRADEGERRCRDLLARGGGADYLIALGRLLQARGRFHDAVAAYQAGLDEIGLTERDLTPPAFPLNTAFELPPADAWQGLGECLIELGDLDGAGRCLELSARARVWPCPWQGLAKLFMARGQWPRAEEALLRAARMSSRDPETYRLLGRLAEQTDRREEAFTLYRHAFRLNPSASNLLEPLARLGRELGKERELEEIVGEYTSVRPNDPRGKSLKASLAAADDAGNGNGGTPA
ncbi:MAG: glycosyltransferase [Pseudomonadota bacterium]